MAKILIVDDSSLMRRNLKYILENAGHQVVGEASDGVQAYSEYVRTEPDLVTMDITMPRVNGLEAIKKIILMDPLANIIIVSAIDQKSSVFEAVKLGAKQYVIKPVTEKVILEKINKVLQLPEEIVGKTVFIPAREELATAESSGQLNGLEASQSAESVPLEPVSIVPFTVEKENGWYLIAIYKQLDAALASEMKDVIQAFSSEPHLKVSFRFVELTQLETVTSKTVKGLVASIEKMGGEVRVTGTVANLM
ncbi:response regulator [Paenibacillus agricola]|uniref:Response regulator n=1 Tax=Paenibacillus agricola TaxID=2716264 RepID=A0ABX0J486_9BACL|nr:response regulator [Paenibacillus agricola]NHN30636.1 response regulator [Paenibacillus agricola]